MSESQDELVYEIFRHQPEIGPYFNLRCKCGYVGTTVSLNGDFERHLADSLKKLFASVWEEGVIAQINSGYSYEKTVKENPYRKDKDA